MKRKNRKIKYKINVKGVKTTIKQIYIYIYIYVKCKDDNREDLYRYRKNKNAKTIIQF